MVGNEEIDALRAIGIPDPRISDFAAHGGADLHDAAGGICMVAWPEFLAAFSWWWSAMLSLSPDAFIEQMRLSVAGSQVVFRTG